MSSQVDYRDYIDYIDTHVSRGVYHTLCVNYRLIQPINSADPSMMIRLCLAPFNESYHRSYRDRRQTANTQSDARSSLIMKFRSCQIFSYTLIGSNRVILAIERTDSWTNSSPTSGIVLRIVCDRACWNKKNAQRRRAWINFLSVSSIARCALFFYFPAFWQKRSYYVLYQQPAVCLGSS